MRKSRRLVDPDMVARLRSAAAEDWMTPAERLAVRRMVAAALASGDHGRVGRLAPSARWRMMGDHTTALAGVEASIVRYRRQLAGSELAAATGQDPSVVAQQLGLGYLSPRDARLSPWTAAGRIA